MLSIRVPPAAAGRARFGDRRAGRPEPRDPEGILGPARAAARRSLPVAGVLRPPHRWRAAPLPGYRGREASAELSETQTSDGLEVLAVAHRNDEPSLEG